MARDCPAQDTNRQRRTRPLAKTQAQRQQRRLAQSSQNTTMGRFGALMACHTVIERPLDLLGEYSRSRAADEAVQNDRYTFDPRPGHCTRHRRDLAATDAAQHL